MIQNNTFTSLQKTSMSTKKYHFNTFSDFLYPIKYNPIHLYSKMISAGAFQGEDLQLYKQRSKSIIFKNSNGSLLCDRKLSHSTYSEILQRPSSGITHLHYQQSLLKLAVRFEIVTDSVLAFHNY